MIDPALEKPILTRLMMRTALGDRLAFAELYRVSSASLFALAERFLGRKDWAEEVLRDSFLQIWQQAAEYQIQRGEPLTWMTIILRDHALDRLRRQRHESPVETPVAEKQTTSNFFDHQQETKLIRCLDLLTPEQRRCLELAFWKGFSRIELASAMSSSLATIKLHVRQALRQLKRCMES